MKKIAVVRGKFLNKFEMQNYEPLVGKFALTGFSSLHAIHKSFSFPIKKLWSPLDVPDFPYKMQLLNRLFIDAHWLWGLERELKGFDIAHSAETYFGYTQQCLNAKEKGYVTAVIATVWENISFSNEGIWGRKRYKKRAIEKVDHFIAVSQKAKEVLIREGVSEEKISIIMPGIDISHFSAKKTYKKEPTNILFVGRLEPEKGVYELLHAFALLVRNHPKLTLTIIGKGREKSSLVHLANTLGITPNIVWKESSYDSLVHEYHQADIFVAPSKATKYWQEQFGMVLAEAHACGLPIVTTNSGSISEVVGECAILVKPGDAVSLHEGIDILLSDATKRKKYGVKARKRAELLFDATKVAKRIGEVYNKVLLQ